VGWPLGSRGAEGQGVGREAQSKIENPKSADRRFFGAFRLGAVQVDYRDGHSWDEIDRKLFGVFRCHSSGIAGRVGYGVSEVDRKLLGAFRLGFNGQVPMISCRGEIDGKLFGALRS
jgi:hypothetical protein